MRRNKCEKYMNTTQWSDWARRIDLRMLCRLCRIVSVHALSISPWAYQRFYLFIFFCFWLGFVFSLSCAWSSQRNITIEAKEFRKDYIHGTVDCVWYDPHLMLAIKWYYRHGRVHFLCRTPNKWNGTRTRTKENFKLQRSIAQMVDLLIMIITILLSVYFVSFHIVPVLLCSTDHFNRLRRSSFTPTFNTTDGFKIVVEESTNDDEEEAATTSKLSTPRESLDIDSPSNPYLLSPWRDPRETRKHSLPSQQVTEGITASQVRRLSERGGEGSGPSPKEAEFLATLSQAPQPSGRRHSVVTISKVPFAVFGRGRRESVAAYPCAGNRYLLQSSIITMKH